MAHRPKTLARLTRFPSVRGKLAAPTDRANEVREEALTILAEIYLCDLKDLGFDFRQNETAESFFIRISSAIHDLDSLSIQRARLLDVLTQRRVTASEWVHSLTKPFEMLRKRLRTEAERLGLPPSCTETADSLLHYAHNAAYDVGYHGQTEDLDRARRALNILRGGNQESSVGVTYRKFSARSTWPSTRGKRPSIITVRIDAFAAGLSQNSKP